MKSFKSGYHQLGLHRGLAQFTTGENIQVLYEIFNFVQHNVVLHTLHVDPRAASRTFFPDIADAEANSGSLLCV